MLLALARTLSVGLILSCLAASTALSSGANGSIRGIVFDATSGQVLSGVTVSAGQGQSSQTNRDGAFVIAGVSPGEFTLTFTRESGGTWRAPSVVVVSGLSTEVIMTLPQKPESPAEVRVEAPRLELAVEEVAEDEGPAVKGWLVGHVVDEARSTPLSGARVYVRGQPVEAKTNAKGVFEIELPVGTHDITVLKAGFAASTQKGIEVSEGARANLSIQLTEVAVELMAFTVMAPSIEGSSLDLLDERKEADRFTDFIGAEQMAKTGDSSAAGALRRVTGVTLVGGKYVYVRGLGERYSSTLLNGSNLPSPEPERRVVPLDLFPTSLLESVVIEKSFSPDRPGEFGGGVVILRTLSYAKGFKAKIGLSSAMTVDQTFTDAPHGDVGPTDWLGIDGGYRALPQAIKDASGKGLLLEKDMFSPTGFTADELEVLGESLPNRWALTQRKVMPDLGLSASVGYGDEFRGGEAGFLLAFGYGNGFKRKLREFTTYDVGGGGELEMQNQYSFNELNQNITLSGMFATGARFLDDHELTLTSLLARVTDYNTRVYRGFNGDLGGTVEIQRLRWVERMLSSNQLRGKHSFDLKADKGLTVDWRYSLALASRDEPDRREARRDAEGDGRWYLSDRPEGNERTFSALEGITHDVGLDLTLTFPQWFAEEMKVKSGFALTIKDRQVDTRRFKFRERGPLANDEDILTLPLEEIFTPEHIGKDGFQLSEVTLNTDSFTAGQLIVAGYAMTDLPLWKDGEMALSVMTGARVESSEQSLETFKPFSPDLEPEVADLKTIDVLPAANFIFNIDETMLLRLGYSRTVSRPDFRELSPAVSVDVTGGRLRFGNPDLKRAQIDNFDLRWEWYFSKTENLSVGAFMKRFTDPIETVVIPSAQLSVSYANAKGALNLGGELEWRKDFGFIDSALDDLYVSGNVAIIHSQVELSGEATTNTSKNRALEGQSPYVINAQLGYDNLDHKVNLALNYNFVARRIAQVGAQGAPDTFQEGFHDLGFVYRHKLPEDFGLSVKLSNLVDSPVRFTQGGKTTDTFRRGRKISVGLSKSFK